TLACRDDPGVFLYAARSASSSAWIRVSSSIPFSFSIVLTASMISLLISVTPFRVIAFVDEVAPHDRVIRDQNSLAAFRAEAESALVRRQDLAAEALASFDVALGAHGNLPSHHAPEVRRRSQRPLEPGRRDVDRVPVQITPQEIADALAERVVHAGGVVD